MSDEFESVLVNVSDSHRLVDLFSQDQVGESNCGMCVVHCIITLSSDHAFFRSGKTGAVGSDRSLTGGDSPQYFQRLRVGQLASNSFWAQCPSLDVLVLYSRQKTILLQINGLWYYRKNTHDK